jgi:XapX domain-containing protein
MTEILLALTAGVLVGIVFSLVKLPLPAPPVLSGIVGIFGIYLGGVGYQLIVERFFQLNYYINSKLI